MPATLPIRLRIGDMPEDEIGTITLEPDGASVWEAAAQALERAAVIVRERAGRHNSVTPTTPIHLH